MRSDLRPSMTEPDTLATSMSGNVVVMGCCKRFLNVKLFKCSYKSLYEASAHGQTSIFSRYDFISAEL